MHLHKNRPQTPNQEKLVDLQIILKAFAVFHFMKDLKYASTEF